MKNFLFGLIGFFVILLFICGGFEGVKFYRRVTADRQMNNFLEEKGFMDDVQEKELIYDSKGAKYYMQVTFIDDDIHFYQLEINNKGGVHIYAHAKDGSGPVTNSNIAKYLD